MRTTSYTTRRDLTLRPRLVGSAQRGGLRCRHAWVVDADQTVVTRGPYRWVHHPSYTGLVLIALGFGLGVGDWLSLAICAVIPVVGLLPRIVVEEAELVRVLGDQYRVAGVAVASAAGRRRTSGR